ncbi:FAD-binding domain-containing protein [Aspergillus piperis CBS 112811]|uniref:FAD-binding domain-containing protein n=1 Tax=Aspergillus piperis CBS 112811 TaxID=1448313 RepID=A0A8G1VRB6_9EURO|nr:FAD-binding domain-containing protein [Aspergillus piperis CBS 112811]RAH61687.1 FAD-binding domain-containing protein [Aspergillus piperis CBS 112811]
MPEWTGLYTAISNGEVLMPSDDGYASSLRRWSKAAELKSCVVVKPACAEEVAAAVKFASASQLSLAVCGGGHSTSGASSSEGMLIHLGNMRRVDADETSMTVSFEGGCLWADIDKPLEARGLAVVGGAVNHTGVGGLILGGGHGWLTAKHGLAIDNLIAVQIVTADGSILDASETENEDLFWAVRGAGAQIGVVTRFLYRVHHQGEVWSGILAFAPDSLPGLLAFANEFHNRDNREGHCLTIGVGHTLDGTTRILTAIPLYHGLQGGAKSYFSGLLNMSPIMDSTKMMSIAEVNTLQNPLCEYGMRRLQGSANVTMPLQIEAFQQMADMVWSFHDDHPNVTVCSMAVELFSTHKLREVPLHDTAYANRGAYYDVVTMFGWTDSSLDAAVRQFNAKLCAVIRNINGYERQSHCEGDHLEAGPVGRYLNMENGPVKPTDAYGDNLERLRMVKNRYDPENIFHKWHGVVSGDCGE